MHLDSIHCVSCFNSHKEEGSGLSEIHLFNLKDVLQGVFFSLFFLLLFFFFKFKIMQCMRCKEEENHSLIMQKQLTPLYSKRSNCFAFGKIQADVYIIDDNL